MVWKNLNRHSLWLARGLRCTIVFNSSAWIRGSNPAEVINTRPRFLYAVPHTPYPTGQTPVRLNETETCKSFNNANRTEYEYTKCDSIWCASLLNHQTNKQSSTMVVLINHSVGQDAWGPVSKWQKPTTAPCPKQFHFKPTNHELPSTGPSWRGKETGARISHISHYLPRNFHQFHHLNNKLKRAYNETVRSLNFPLQRGSFWCRY